MRRPEYLDGPGVCFAEVEQCLDAGGLARAVDTDERQRLSRPDGEAHAVEDGTTPDAPRNVAKTQRRGFPRRKGFLVGGHA